MKLMMPSLDLEHMRMILALWRSDVRECRWHSRRISQFAETSVFVITPVAKDGQ
jgi:hypothetical protein